MINHSYLLVITVILNKHTNTHAYTLAYIYIYIYIRHETKLIFNEGWIEEWIPLFFFEKFKEEEEMRE